MSESGTRGTTRGRARMGGERGFTMIELAFILLIIGIMITVAIPMYAGAAARARDTAAQTTLRDAIKAAHLHYFMVRRTYDGFDPASGERILPTLAWSGPGEPAEDGVAISTAEGRMVQLVVASGTGTYFCARVAPDAIGMSTVTFGSGDSYEDVDDPVECTSATW